MALNPSGLTTAMKAATEAALQAEFTSISSELRPADITRIQSCWSRLANAIATGDAPVTIAHFRANADVRPIALSGPNLFDPLGQLIVIDTGVAAGDTGHVTTNNDIDGLGSIN